LQALGLSLLLVLSATALFWFVAFFIPGQRQAAVDSWRRDLDVRAEIRKVALERYFGDGLADAQTLAAYPTALEVLATNSAGAGRTVADTGVPTAHLEELFGDFVRVHGALGVVLWDAEGKSRVKSSDLVLDAACTVPAREVLASGAPAVGFHLHAGMGALLTFSAPVRGANGEVHGAVVVAVDPHAWLYPLLERPLGGTSTGEALIVGRDGADVVYLSPLRDRPDAPLRFRRPLDDPGFAARAALEGSLIVGHYVDYRGVRVLAGGRRIPPSPWALVVKIDEKEALAAFRKDMLQKGATWGALLLALAAAAVGFWRALVAANEVKVAQSEARSRALMQDVLDHGAALIYIVDIEGRFLLGNRALESVLGVPREKILGRTREAFMPEQIAAEHRENDLEVIGRRQSLALEETNEEPDGRHVYSTVKFPLLDAQGTVYAVAGMSTDITERRRAEDRILHLNRLLRTISEINQIIVHVDDRKTLIGEACRVLVEHGGFRMAWIGFVDPMSSRVVPEARAGDGLSYLDGIEIRTDDMAQGRGPAGTAIRTGAHVVVPNVETDPSVAPWRERMLENGIRAIGSFPLRVRGEITGVLIVYRSDLVPFSVEETAHLDELAGDIGYALEVLEIRAENRRAEEALGLSEERFRIAAETSNDVIYEWDLKERVDWFGDIDGLLGYGPGEFPRTLTGWSDFLHPEDRSVVMASIRAHLEGRAPYIVEYRMFRRDGSVRWWSARGSVARLPDGAPSRWVGTITDITERKQADEALRESESRFRQLAESLPQLVWTCQPDGPCDYFNRRWLEFTGVPEAPQLGFGWLEQLHPDDRAPTVAAWEAAVASGADFRVEFRIRRHDGEYRWFDTQAARLLDAEGQTVKWFGSNTDITERRRTEEALRTNEARLRSLFDGMLEGYAHCEVVFDRGEAVDWVYLDVNPAFETLTGLKDVVGKRVTEVIPGFREANPGLLEIFGRVASTGESKIFEDNVPGLKRWYAMSAYSPRTGEFVAVFDDISERKNFEAALRESEDKFKYIFEHSIVGKSITLVSGVVQANKAFSDMLGYSPDELKEQTWQRISHPDDVAATEEQIRALLAGEQESARFSKRYVHKNGSIVWGDVSTSLRRDSAGRPLYFMTAVNDVTERKRAEEEVYALNETLEERVKDRTRELEAANKELEAFSYSVSHDLRSPLRAVDGFSRILLEDHAPQLDAEGKRLLGIVRSNTRKMGQLIDDLLSFSRIGRQEMARQAVDMRALADEALGSLVTADEMVSFTVGELPCADVDPSLMRQVWVNLISNAVKFTRPKAERAIEIAGRIEPGRVVYSVKDNGVGFDMAYVNKLFGVFQRLHSSHEFEGTGVGLALVQRIVHRHGGEVWAEGKVGEGATFSFSLPRQGGLS